MCVSTMSQAAATEALRVNLANDFEDVEEIFGPRPWVSRSEEILNANKISNEMKQANEAAQKRNEAATEKHEEPQVEAEEKPEDNKEQ